MIANDYMCNNDLYNKEGKRTIKNTSKGVYNCGGYALEIFNWYCPYGEGRRGGQLFGWCPDYDLDEVLEITVDFMLEDFKGELRKINDISELKEDEYAIAYRVGESDFHFAKRSKNGNWYHKRGNCPEIERMKKDEVFGDSWGRYEKYNSDVVLLAKKRNPLLN